MTPALDSALVALFRSLDARRSDRREHLLFVASQHLDDAGLPVYAAEARVIAERWGPKGEATQSLYDEIVRTEI